MLRFLRENALPGVNFPPLNRAWVFPLSMAEPEIPQRFPDRFVPDLGGAEPEKGEGYLDAETYPESREGRPQAHGTTHQPTQEHSHGLQDSPAEANGQSRPPFQDHHEAVPRPRPKTGAQVKVGGDGDDEKSEGHHGHPGKETFHQGDFVHGEDQVEKKTDEDHVEYRSQPEFFTRQRHHHAYDEPNEDAGVAYSYPRHVRDALVENVPWGVAQVGFHRYGYPKRIEEQAEDETDKTLVKILHEDTPVLRQIVGPGGHGRYKIRITWKASRRKSEILPGVEGEEVLI